MTRQPRLIRSFYPLIIKLSNLSLQQQLQQFLLTQLADLDRLKFPPVTSREKPISLFRLPTINSITYRCAIAFQLSRHSSISPITLAQGLFNTLQSQATYHPDHLSLHFTLKLLDPGWLEFTLCDRSLYLWLQSWPTFSYSYQKSPLTSRNHDNLWILQYTYARCCTLLRLGEQEGLIQLKNQQFKPYSWSLSTSQLIPWSNLVLNQFERSLIAQLIITVDRLVNELKVKGIKLALALSESFLNFECHCRIFGETSRHNPQLSQARLGLVAITQFLVQGLWLSNIEQPLRNRL
ncbi:MAG: arginyl-tRNA synthetase [Crocosphaera sp.]|nr:arginyl-tRNA synthetase [Crocosphaera sp.]